GVRSSFCDRAKDGLEGGAGHRGYRLAEKLNRSGFTEGAGLSLESDANGFAIGCDHGYAISCNRPPKTESRGARSSSSAFARLLAAQKCFTNLEFCRGSHGESREILGKTDRKSTRLNSSHQIISYA